VGVVSISQFLMLYVWFLLSVLLLLLFLIARFYERSSHERTYFHLYALPIVLFGIATARYSSINQIAGDGLGDILMAGAGIALIGLCVFLYYLMTRGR
jgi:hypothetical protein